MPFLESWTIAISRALQRRALLMQQLPRARAQSRQGGELEAPRAHLSSEGRRRSLSSRAARCVMATTRRTPKKTSSQVIGTGNIVRSVSVQGHETHMCQRLCVH